MPARAVPVRRAGAAPPAGRVRRRLCPGAEQPAQVRGTLADPGRVPLQQNPHPHRVIAAGPADLHRRGRQLAACRGGDHPARLGRPGRAHGGVRGGRGQRMQPEHRLHDQPERPVGARVQLAEVVAGHVLDHLAARGGHGAVGAYHGDPDHQVARRPVAQAPWARRAGGERPADRAGAGRLRARRLGRPGRPRRLAGRHIEGKLLPGGRQHLAEPPHPGPGLEPGHQIPGRVLDHLVQPQRVDHQVAARWRGAPVQPAPLPRGTTVRSCSAATRITALASATLAGEAA